MRTWAPTTRNVRGVASSFGCGTTVRAACGRGLATQLGRACGRGWSSSLDVHPACRARLLLGAQHSQMPLSQKREIQSSVVNRFAAGVTLPPGRLMCVDSSCSCLLQSGWRCGYQHGVAYQSCGEACSNLLAFPCMVQLLVSGCGYCWWILLQHGTGRSVRS